MGIKGQDKMHGPYTTRESAIQEFELKFLAKTKNHWSDRKSFVSHPKSYAWLEMDYSGNDEESSVSYNDYCFSSCNLMNSIESSLPVAMNSGFSLEDKKVNSREDSDSEQYAIVFRSQKSPNVY